MKEIISSGVARVQFIYSKASNASVGRDRCNKLISKYHSEHMNLKRNNKSLNSSKNTRVELKNSKNILEQKFLTDRKNAQKFIVGFVHIENTYILV